MNLRQIRWVVALFVIIAAGESCGRKSRKPDLSTPTSGKVQLYADESFRPVVEPLLQVFNGIYSYASVSCEYQPENDVINALLEFRTPMVFATRRLTRQENDYFVSKKYQPRENLFAMDAIAMIVNQTVKDSTISVRQIGDILTGKKGTWAQVGFTSLTDSIQVVFDNPGSGTVRFMMDSACQGAVLGRGSKALRNNDEVIDFVSRNPGALGVIGVAWISSSRNPVSLEKLKKVKVLRVSSNDPATYKTSFLPYQAFIKGGTYPLIRYLYLINAEPHKGLATGVASFVCSDRGQRIILNTGIMPANEPVRNVKITD